MQTDVLFQDEHIFSLQNVPTDMFIQKGLSYYKFVYNSHLNKYIEKFLREDFENLLTANLHYALLYLKGILRMLQQSFKVGQLVP